MIIMKKTKNKKENKTTNNKQTKNNGGTFGDVRDIWVSGEPWGNLGQHFSLSFLKGCPGNLRGCPGHLSGGCPGNRRGRDSIFLKDFLRDVRGTLRGRCPGNLRGCPGNLGGTLGSTFPYQFLRDVGGTFGDVGDISRAGVGGTAGGPSQVPLQN